MDCVHVALSIDNDMSTLVCDLVQIILRRLSFEAHGDAQTALARLREKVWVGRVVVNRQTRRMRVVLDEAGHSRARVGTVIRAHAVANRSSSGGGELPSSEARSDVREDMTSESGSAGSNC